MSVAGSRPVLLYCHSSMEQLAKNTIADLAAKSTGTQRTYRKVELRCGVDGIRWDNFGDGWPNIFIDNVQECAGKDVLFIASFHSKEVVFEQMSVIYAFPRYLAHSFTLILPYFPTGTMERVDTEGQIATAKTLANMLSGIPLTARGPAQIVLYDVHALQERFYFSNQVIPRLVSAVPLLLKRIAQLADHDKVTIAFPDPGARKRFYSFFPNTPLIMCSKVRKGDERVVNIMEGDAKDRHVIIVDDLVMTGGTLMECAKAVKREGACSVSAYVTHAVFPRMSWKRFTAAAENGHAHASPDTPAVKNGSTPAVAAAENGGSPILLKHFWVTDSLPTVGEFIDQKPFELLSLSSSITETLLSYDLQT